MMPEIAEKELSKCKGCEVTVSGLDPSLRVLKLRIAYNDRVLLLELWGAQFLVAPAMTWELGNLTVGSAGTGLSIVEDSSSGFSVICDSIVLGEEFETRGLQ